jgi:hypothetical protein
MFRCTVRRVLTQVHIFRGTRRVFGFTKDGTAANLPGQYGPWTAFTIVKMTRDEPKQGVNTDECIDDIEKYGFHLTDAHVRITERVV